MRGATRGAHERSLGLGISERLLSYGVGGPSVSLDWFDRVRVSILEVLHPAARDQHDLQCSSSGAHLARAAVVRARIVPGFVVVSAASSSETIPNPTPPTHPCLPQSRAHHRAPCHRCRQGTTPRQTRRLRFPVPHVAGTTDDRTSLRPRGRPHLFFRSQDGEAPYPASGRP